MAGKTLAERPVLRVTWEGIMGNLVVEQAGVFGICHRPFEIDTLRRLIQSILNDV